MQSFRIAHEYDSSPAAYWALFFDDAYNRAFYDSAEIDFEVLRDDSKDGCRERAVRCRSRQPVPALLRRFLPEGLGYVEHSSFDEKTGRYEQRVEPNAFGSRAEILGVLCAEQLPAGRMRRVYSGTVSIQVPLLGAKLEADTIASMKKAQDRADVVTREWLARAAHHQPSGSPYAAGGPLP